VTRDPFAPPQTQPEAGPHAESASAAELVGRVKTNIERVIVGKPDVVELALITLLSDGHLLIEDVPGTGKTMLARALAGSLALHFKRIQFTPDLLPSDVTGLTVYHQKTEEFAVRPGPVFSNILLADEINRATPRTQAALLECMGESQVTVDGKTYALPKTFFVIATQNPIESQGTFPLPEAQLDRFLMKISVGYPGRAEEVSILFAQQHEHPINGLSRVAGEAEVQSMRAAVKDVHVDPAIGEYIVDIVAGTRAHPSLAAGSSPRGSLALMRASQAAAYARGESFVRPHVVKRMAPYVLAHRVILHPQVRISGATTERVIAEILNRVPVPTQFRESLPSLRQPSIR
jgi:MoxR-like ATPase